MSKAAGLDVDHVFLDLEDAVAPNAKEAARGRVVEALNTHEWKPKTVCVRINDVETQYCHDDIIEVVTGAGDKLDTIMLTKAKSAHDVMFVHLLLDQLEEKLGLTNSIGIECLIEEVEGMMVTNDEHGRDVTQPHPSLTAELDPAICWTYYLERKHG